MNPLQYIDQHQEKLFETYRELHSLAEPSWEEKETSRYIANRLQEAGLHVKTFSNHYGVIAEISGESCKVVGLRADLDALVQEVNGVVRPNHSCGHDAHSTMVLYAALALANSKIKPKHTLRFIFQPAEEKGQGALQMMKEAALHNVEYLFGIHLRPHFEVPFGMASPVIIHGAAGSVRGTVKGVQAHASRPGDGINAIEAAALLALKLKALNIDTTTPYSIKMTKLRTDNEASNVIPETAHFSLDARAQSNQVMEELKRLTSEAIQETEVETGVKISWSMAEFVPAATINEHAIKMASAAIREVLGAEKIIPSLVSNGGEDFHFYTERYPKLMATMIGLGCDLSPGLHHPLMEFNIEALHYGTKILTQLVLTASGEQKIESYAGFNDKIK